MFSENSTAAVIPPEAAKLEWSFEDQVLDESAALKGLARYLCRDAGEAEDLLQEVLMRALRYRHQFRPGTNLRAWLKAIMRNTHALRRRRRSREAPYDPAVAEYVTAITSDPTISLELDDVRRVLNLLPTQWRDVLLLAAGGRSYDEISFVLGLPMGTVKSRISRARDRLQAVLAEGNLRALDPCHDPLAALENQFAALSPSRPPREPILP